MLTLDELSQHIAAYKRGYLSLEQFENWFEDNSNGAYAVPEVSEACAAVDVAFSEYYFDHIGENALKQELEKAIRPFAYQSSTASVIPIEIVYGKPPMSAGTANPWHRRTFSVVA